MVIYLIYYVYVVGSVVCGGLYDQFDFGVLCVYEFECMEQCLWVVIVVVVDVQDVWLVREGLCCEEVGVDFEGYCCDLRVVFVYQVVQWIDLFVVEYLQVFCFLQYVDQLCGDMFLLYYVGQLDYFGGELVLWVCYLYLEGGVFILGEGYVVDGMRFQVGLGVQVGQLVGSGEVDYFYFGELVEVVEIVLLCVWDIVD